MAGRVPDAWLDDLRSRVDIVDVVSDYVALKQKGKRYWGLCPFHNEKTASFSVNPDEQMYYCFGCHKGGNAIGFVMEMERIEFMDAVTLLAERVHLPIPETTGGEKGPSRTVKELIYQANLAAARYYHGLIWTGEGAKALSYLNKRGLDDAAIRRFGLGASPTDWQGLTRTLLNQGFTEEVLLQAGLSGKKQERVFDMFRERVMFPIIDARGRVLGFGGRAMGDAMPKYLNTPDTPVFNKRCELYALNFVAKERALKRLILVEGYMDVIALRRAGVAGVVATLGTALTEEQARLIKRRADEVWVSYDGDAAGQKAILRALDIFEAQGMRARVLSFPDGMDPDDFIRARGAKGFDELKPMDPVAYRMQRAADAVDMTTQEGRTQYAIACCELLRAVRNPVELENYISRLMIDTGFARDVLIRQIGASAQSAERVERPVRREARAARQYKDYERAERMLVLLLSARLLPPDAVKTSDFETALYARIAGKLLDGVSGAALLDQLNEDERQEAVSALNAQVVPDEGNALKVAEDCLKTLYAHRLERSISELEDKLSSDEGESRQQTLRQMMELTQELDRFKTSRKEWTV